MLPINFHRISELHSGPALLLSDNGTILAANQHVAEVLGLLPGRLVGTSFSALANGQAPPLKRFLENFPENQSSSFGPLDFSNGKWQCEATVLQPESEKAGRFYLRLIPSPEPQPLASPLDQLSHDLAAQVTPKTPVERELLEHNKWLQVTLSSIGDGVIVTDTEARVTFLNAVSEELTGWSQEEAAGMPLTEVFRIVNEDTHQSVENPVMKAIREGQIVGLANHTLLIAKDGTERPIADSAAPIQDDEGNLAGVVLVFRDVTERSRSEKRLKAQHAVTRILSESVSLDEAVPNILEAICQSSGWDIGQLWLVDPRSGQLQLENHWCSARIQGEEFETISRHITVQPGRGLLGGIWSSKKPQWVADLANNSVSPRAKVAERAGLHAACGFPILLQNQVIGILEFVNHRIRELDEDLLAMMGAIGSQIGQFIERKKAETALWESEARFRAFMETHPALAWMKDEQFRYVYVNETWADFFRLTKEGWQGKTDFDVWPDIAQKLRENDETVLHDGKPMQLFEDVPAPDGKLHHWLVCKFPFACAKDKQFVGGIAFDLTEQRRAEQTLRASEENLRMALAAGRMGSWKWDIPRNRITFSPDLERIHGLAPGQFEGTFAAFQRNIHSGDRERVLEAITTCMTHGGELGIEYRIHWPDGTIRWLENRGRATEDANGRHVHMRGICADITDRKQTEVALQKANEMQRHSQKMEAVGRLAGGVAHDFNNLLTVINGYSEYTLESLKAHDPLYENITEISKAAERAAKLTRQLLLFSRKEIVAPTVLDLNSLISEMEKLLLRLIGEDIEIATILSPQLGKIKADPGQIEQVVMNLAVNARDAMPQGGKLTIETKNTELEETYTQMPPDIQPGRYVLLTISDSGCGMDADTKARVFEPFFTTKPAGTGTGMGLSTVYGIVKQARGHIALYSELGHGTTFKIYWPRVEQSLDQSGNERPVETNRQGTETILVVEDEEMVRTFACRVLKSQGYTVLEARNGGEALLTCEQHQAPIHLLLTDVVMPQMSGRELADRLRQVRPQMKVLFMSGYTDDAIVRNGVLEAEMAFMQKPFSPSVLGKKLREVLDQLETRT